tara:strand:+ start:115 stop:621 length:507 start_codon:yes stop_codon:yes gene_type:complete
MFRFTIVLLILALVSCTTTREVIQRVPYNELEYVHFKEAGTAKVTGQAFLRTSSGDVKYAAGSRVSLVPVTSISNQWYYQWYLVENHINPEKVVAKADTRHLAIKRRTQADGEGKFTFRNIPAGEYFINTSVVWKVDQNTVGGFISNKVSIEDGESHNFVITRRRQLN